VVGVLLCAVELGQLEGSLIRDSTLTLSLTLNLAVGLFHIKTSATNINLEELQPHDSQNWIIEPSDYRYITSWGED